MSISPFSSQSTFLPAFGSSVPSYPLPRLSKIVLPVLLFMDLPKAEAGPITYFGYAAACAAACTAASVAALNPFLIPSCFTACIALSTAN